MVILDSYVNDILSYIVAKRITGRVCKDGLCFSKYGCFCITYSQTRCTVMSEKAVQSINRKIKCELKWKKISTRACSFSV